MGATTIPLQIGNGVTPVQSPIQTATQGLDLNRLAGAVQIQRQMQAENALKIQSQQEDRTDDSIFQQAMSDNHQDFNAARKAAVDGGVHLRNLQKFDADHMKWQQAANALDNDTLLKYKNQTSMAYDAIRGVMETPNSTPAVPTTNDEGEEDSTIPGAAPLPTARSIALADAKKRLALAGINPDQFGILQSADDQALRADVGRVGYMKQLTDEEDKKRKAVLDDAKAKALDVKEKAASLPGMHAEAASAFQGIDNQADYDKAVTDFAAQDADHAAYAKRFLSMPYRDSTVDVINRRAMKPEDRVKEDKPVKESNPTETTLAMTVAQGKKPGASPEDVQAGVIAEAALKRLDQSKKDARPVTNITLTPAERTNTAQLAVSGKMSPQTLRAAIRRDPNLLSDITNIDPKFDEGNIENRYETLKEFNNTSVSKAGGQSLALNTLIHHADLYQQAADALKNGSFKPGNAAYNAVASAFGSAPPQSADLVARFLAGETGKVATGGVPAEGEINGILKSLSSANSSQQIKDAGDKLLQIAGGRAFPLIEKAQQAKIDNIVQVIGPDARRILTERGFDPNTMKPVAAVLPKGNGAVIDKATAQKFYTAAGNDPKKAQKLAEDNGWKVQ